MEADIDEVSKMAHNIKSRLEALDEAVSAEITGVASLLQGVYCLFVGIEWLQETYVFVLVTWSLPSCLWAWLPLARKF